MDRCESVGRAHESLGKSFTSYANYELDSEFIRLPSPAMIGRVIISFKIILNLK